MYCPALTQGDKTQEEYRTRNVFKMKFNKLLELRANALCDAGFHVMILGDLNISHKPIDHCNPSEVSIVIKTQPMISVLILHPQIQ